MDNRFNIKDIVLIVLILGVGLMIGLSMVQQDRQWKLMQESLTELQLQSDTVASYERQLDQYQADQKALRDGVQSLIEVLQSSAGTEGGPRLGGDVAINLDATRTEDDPTFARVADLQGRSDYAEGDYFIDTFSATVKSLTPYIAGDLYQQLISEYVLDTLLSVNPQTLEFEPLVARTWDVSEDGLVVTFHLRDDVVFSDGEPLTSEDVVFTYEWVMNPQVAAPRTRAYFEKLESVEALDEYTVRFTFREPYFAALSLCGSGFQILPKHWVSQFTEDQYNEMPGLLFGSGPYRLEENPRDWQPGSSTITLVRNDNYWGPRPALDRIIWREILEPTAQVTAFRNREIDRLTVRPSTYRNLSTDPQLRDQSQLYEYEYVSSGYIYIGWNQLRNGQATAFADRRVRQAMTMLINREQICGQVYQNLAQPTSGPFHPLGWQADPNIEPWPFDPARAVALLEEAGYIDRDGNGIRESANGQPLSFEFIYSTGSDEATDMARLITDSMRQAGVACNATAMDWPVMQQKLDDRNFDAIMLGWGGSVENDVYQMFHSDQVQDGGDNYVHYINPELDRLIEQARTTVDRERDRALWNQVHATLHEDQPYTFMMTRMSVVYVDRRFQNVEITKVGMNRAWEYYVPQSDQLHTGN